MLTFIAFFDWKIWDNSTWLVNSAAHLSGYGSHPTGDRSTNCWWVALLTYGGGWHNNHHAFPSSARQGLRWWELDMTWWMVRGLPAVGLARRVKLPSLEEQGGSG